jgi:hypothetical protein
MGPWLHDRRQLADDSAMITARSCEEADSQIDFVRTEVKLKSANVIENNRSTKLCYSNMPLMKDWLSYADNPGGRSHPPILPTHPRYKHSKQLQIHSH